MANLVLLPYVLLAENLALDIAAHGATLDELKLAISARQNRRVVCNSAARDIVQDLVGLLVFVSIFDDSGYLSFPLFNPVLKRRKVKSRVQRSLFKILLLFFYC